MVRRLGLAGLGLLGLVPLGLADYPLYVATLALVYAIAAMGLNITLGYAGQISLAQAAFMGIGAYTLALGTGAGLSFWLALPAAGALAFAAGMLLGYPALKVRHHYLAMVTLAFSVLAFLVMRNAEGLTGGSMGITGIERPRLGPFSLAGDRAYYLVVLAVTWTLAGAAAWVVRGPWGRGLRALRENELRAETLGINLRNYKVAAFAIGALYGGVAGALLAALIRYIDPTPFVLERSIQLLLMVVVGGLGSLAGPFLGAVLVTVAPELLRITQGLYLVLFSALVIVLVLVLPSGLASLPAAARASGRRPSRAP